MNQNPVSCWGGAGGATEVSPAGCLLGAAEWPDGGRTQHGPGSGPLPPLPKRPARGL